MCGIVGYAGPRAQAPSSRPVDVALQGLARLEYRGYDSAGVAVIDDGSVRVTKRAGKLANLREALDGATETTGQVAIAHTRWATHGGPTDTPAHLVAREMERFGDLTEAMRRTAALLEGAFTLLAVHRDAPDTVVAARRNSPLVVGLGEGENFLGSDVAAFVDSTKEALEIGQD